MNHLEETDHHHPLYEITPPLETGFLRVSDEHELYYATYGNPKGTPIVLLHGGPGVGFQENTLRVINPKKYYIIAFDQRGAVRSKPFGSIIDNTAQHLVSDIEKIRTHFKIDKWVVFGGSWGSALALLYGQAYPDRCLAFILRGVNLLRKPDYEHLVGGMGKIFPEAFEPVVSHIPPEERSDLIAAYHRRVFSNDPQAALDAATLFMRYDLICGTHLPDHAKVEEILKNEKMILSTSRMFLHYALHHFFLTENQILENMPKISHIPGYIIHGRWDAICLPEMAYLLYKAWQSCTLWIPTQGGHSGGDPAIMTSLATATDLFIV